MSRDESEWLRGNGKAALCHNHVWNEKKRKKANNGAFISSESRASNKIVIIAGTKRKKRSTRSTRFTVSLNRKQKYLFFTCHFCPTNRHFFYCLLNSNTNQCKFIHAPFFDYHSNVLLYMICLWLFGDRPRQRSWRLHYPRWPWSGVVKPQMCYRRNIQHSKWPLTDESLGRNRNNIYWASSPQKPAHGVSVPIEIHFNYTLASIVCVCVCSVY